MESFVEKMKHRVNLLQLLAKKRAVRVFLPHPTSKALFVVGNQRSGTTMLLRQLNHHTDVDVYHEDSKVMKHFRIKELSYIKEIIEKSKAKVVVFKPLEDSHRTLEFLEKFAGSKAILMFRHFSDVINSSMVHGWGKHHQENIKRIYNQEHLEYSEPLNLNKDNVKLVRDMYDPRITPETCIALVWYLRNTIYFDYGMQNNDDILLVQYEKLVSNPIEQIKNILNFVGLSDAESVSKGIHAKSIRKQPERQIRNDAKELCNDYYEKLVKALKSDL